MNTKNKIFYIPTIPKEQEAKYSAFLFSGNLMRSPFLFGVSTILASILSTYYALIYRITAENKAFFTSLSSISLLIFVFVSYLASVRLREINPLESKKIFLFFSYLPCLIIIIHSIVVMVINDSSFIFYSFTLLIASLLYFTPKMIALHYTTIISLHIIIMLIANNLSSISLFASCIVAATGVVISYAVYINKYTEFELLSHLRDNNYMLLENNKELSVFSYSDALTGVNNRRRIEDILKKEWKKCKEKQLPISIIFIDIDNFKLYNDTYGHVEGDKCLIQVASAIEFLCSSLPLSMHCSMGRYGGEEFIVILPNSTEETVCSFGEKLVEAIRSLNIANERVLENPFITISCGATSMIPDENKRILYILETADQALYYIKSHGKNNILHFNQLNRELDEQEKNI